AQSPESITLVFDPHRNPPVWVSQGWRSVAQLSCHTPICSDFKHGNSILRRDVFASGTDESENGQFIQAWIIYEGHTPAAAILRVNGRQTGSDTELWPIHGVSFPWRESAGLMLARGS